MSEGDDFMCWVKIVVYIKETKSFRVFLISLVELGGN